MEFSFNVNLVLKDRLTVLHGGGGGGGRLKSFRRDPHNSEIGAIVNEMGVASSKAQGLKAPITSYARFMQSPDQTIYLLKDSEMNNGNGSVLGFIKTGRKRLFLTDNRTLLHEVEPLCIMDFYVHETQQRRGHGKELFENVLQEEGLSAFEVAIDRPSSKFLSFLQRHYQLSSYVKQNNNFVVFDKFFTTCSHVDHGRGMHRRHSLPSSMHANTNGVTAGRTRGLRMSLSPLKNNELQSLVKLFPSPPPPSSSNNTISSVSNVANPLSATSLTGSTPGEESHTLTHDILGGKGGGVGGVVKRDVIINASPSVPWNMSLMSGSSRVGRDIDGDSKAPYLTMRSTRHVGRRGGFDNHWGFGFNNQLEVRHPEIQYSRYNCDRDKNSKSSTSIKSSTTTGNILSFSSTSSSIKNHSWKGFLH